MGLRLKFNIAMLAVFLIGLTLSAWVFYVLLQQQARRQVVHDAELMMEAALAVRGYTIDQIKPLLDGAPSPNFLPQTVPAFSAIETFNTLKKKYPEYSYREATLNPTNPRDQTAPWEATIVEAFRANSEQKETVGVLAAASGDLLYMARPIRITNPACLQCHSTPEAAPPSMITAYGPAKGFGWNLNEVIGAQVVTVPMTLPKANADESFKTFMVSLAAIVAALFLVLNWMLKRMIIRPIMRVAEQADLVSKGDFSQPALDIKGRDEVSVLARSFNRMRASIVIALKHLRQSSPKA